MSVNAGNGGFDRAAVWRVLGRPALCLALGALALRVAGWLGWLPAPRPILDMDRTVLLHQAWAVRQPRTADVVLLGDSSCLMDVWAADLGRRLGEGTLNLATFGFVDLATHARLLRQYARANPGRPRLVALLVHPQTLRRQTTVPYYAELVDAYSAGREPEAPEGVAGILAQWLSLDQARDRGLGRFLPRPLPGKFGVYYGFTSDLWHYLERHQGSAVDPSQYDPHGANGSPEYRLAKQWEVPSRAFRAALPTGTRLVVGLTPAPASFVLPDHAVVCRRMLVDWAAWLRADGVLTNLPTVLPDALFASVTHLNEAGARRFTELVAAELITDAAVSR